MASIEKIERVLEGVTYNRVTLGLAYFRAVKTGTLKAITLYRSTTGGTSGVWYLNVRQNGSSLFSGAGRPSFSLGVGMATKTGLSVSVTAGDVFTLDIEQTGGGAITGNLVWVLEFENDDTVVLGPGAAVTDNAVVLFDGTTGELLQDSATVLSTDGTLAANSDIKIPTEKAVKTYVDANSGAAALDDLTDVDATSPSDGDVLTYDSGSGLWIPGTPSGGGGGGGFDVSDPTNAAFVYDDFLNGPLSLSGPLTDSTQYGSPFSLTLNSTGTANLIPVAGRPGVWRITDNDWAGSGGFLSLGRLSPQSICSADSFDITAIVSFRASGAFDYRIGLMNPTVGFSTFNNYIGIESSQASGDGSNFYARCHNGSSTRALLGSFSTSAWYKLRIWRSSSSEISFSVNGGTPVTITTHIPLSTEFLGLMCGLRRYSFAANQYLYIDYLSLKVTGLTR